jgi:hypothetical protein
MTNASDTIGNRNRALRIVAQCLSEMCHHVPHLHYVQYLNMQEIYALLSPIRRVKDFRTSNPNLFTSIIYLVLRHPSNLALPYEVAAASA